MSQTPRSSSAGSRRRLGRGLTSLINTPVRVETNAPAVGTPPSKGEVAASPSTPTGDLAGSSTGLQLLPVERIRPNRYQPRQQFDEASLDTLATSIREAGMMQPVVVRPRDGAYELIAGERRWRAARRVGLEKVPAIVRDVDAQTAAQFALIENLHREDLNAIERAEAFRRLADDFELTHQEIAERVGLDRTSVTNHLRMLELDEEARAQIAAGALSMGHGRALLALTNLVRRRAMAARAAREGWSVRELERRVKRDVATGDQIEEPSRTRSSLPPHLKDLERKLGEHLGLKVAIQPGRKKGAGSLKIDFFTLDEFEGLLERLSFNPE